MADLLSTPRESELWAALEQEQRAAAAALHGSYSRMLELWDLAVRQAGPGADERAVEGYLALDLAGTLRQGQGKARGRCRDARRLRDVLSRTWQALGERVVWPDQVAVILWELKDCTAAVAAEVERRLFVAGGERECPSDLRRRLRHDVLAVEALLEPGTADQRERDAFQARTARRVPLPSGMSGLWSTHTVEQGALFDAGLDVLCRQAKTDDDAHGVVRTAEQRRADVLASLPGRLLVAQARAAAAEAARDTAVAAMTATRESGAGGAAGAGGTSGTPGGGSAGPETPPGPRPGAGPGPAPSGHGCGCEGLIYLTAVINVHIPMASALGLADEPGHLDGHGPLSASHIRRLLPSARIRLVAVDESTGRPIDVAKRTSAPAGSHESARQVLLSALDRLGGQGWLVDDTPEAGYRLSAGLSRRIKVRDMRCSGPGCGQAACHCDDEHLRPHAQGGQTSAANTGPVSRGCHNAKTHGHWTYQPHEDGSCTWTSPRGRSYTKPAFWRPPPDLSTNPTLRPPDDPGLIGHASPRGPTPPTEAETARLALPDEHPDQHRRPPGPPRTSCSPYTQPTDGDDPCPDTDDCPF